MLYKIYQGAKGGVKINPFDYSEDELMRISKGYVSSMIKYFGEDKDIPAPVWVQIQK